ncbi:MAG: hypothetical protein WEE36_01370, partial [Acidimicrobiia bacterium]
MNRAFHRPPAHLMALLGLALMVSACGDALTGIGDLSERVVHGDGTVSTTTTTPTGIDLNLKGVTDVAWFNDGLGADSGDMGREETIAEVWARGNSEDPFIQASRREVARSLPGVQFPQLVPAAITHVTSQLVFDVATASLDPSTAVAFGLWTGEPYTLPRAEGQLVVLRVGLKTFEGDPEDEIFSFQVTDGQELVWTHGDFVYQLFCRRGVSDEACFAIADS